MASAAIAPKPIGAFALHLILLYLTIVPISIGLAASLICLTQFPLSIGAKIALVLFDLALLLSLTQTLG